MKKFLALIIALVMALSLVACGEQKQPDTPDVPDDGEQQQTASIKVGFITLHKREEDAEVLVPRRGSGRILILNRRGYGGVSGYDFWVNIPLALYDKLDITQVRAVVDAYKLASKRFSINYI